MAFELPALPYAFDALEPHIDKLTMEIHHGKHHQAYITNLNKEITGTEMEKQTIEEICKNASKTSMAVRNNGGGHFNAAGGQNKEPLVEVVDMFMKAMKENKDQLSNYQF